MPSANITTTTTEGLMHRAGRQSGYRRIGTIIPEGTSVADGLQIAGLADWNVRTEPLTVVTVDGMYPMPRNQIILRTVEGQTRPIAPTGKQYKPVQNEELAEFAQAVLDDSDLVLDTAGDLDDGRRVFMVLRSPTDLTFGGIDKVTRQMVIATGHDGTLATSVKPLFERIFCTNQVSRLVFGKGRIEYRLRHTSSIKGRVAQARDALGLTFNVGERFAQEVERLLTVKVSDLDWRNVVEALAPIDNDLPAATATRRMKVRDDLWTLWRADTQQPIKGTAWAGVNAVGEYFDWMGAGASDAAKRARAQVLGTREAAKAAATAKMLAVVGA